MRTPAALLAAMATLLLVACNQPDTSGATSAQAASTASIAPPASTATQVSGAAVAESAIAGHYTIGGTTVQLREALRLPDQQGKLRLLLTPDALSAEEKAKVQAESWTGMSLFSKRTAEYTDRYPFVVIEVGTEGVADAGHVRQFYVMASSINVPNHTDNITRAAHDHGVELLELQGDRVRLRTSGQQEINGESREWSFDVDA